MHSLLFDDNSKKKDGKVDVKDKVDSPFDFLNDIDDEIGSSNNRNLPSVPDSDNKDQDKDQGNGDDINGIDDLSRASRAKTRSKVSNIGANDEIRRMLNVINRDQDDEIDDAEAARRAGLDIRPGDDEVVVRSMRDVPQVLNRDIRAEGGRLMPEWSTINNLPGYMQRAIRGMGRQIFRMFTRTPLEDILTIANVNGQGPNSAAEMSAVAAWLRAHGEDRGEVEMDYGAAIPGYRPEVREYSARGIRFHVIRDFAGVYIYAFPESDAVIGGEPTTRIARESNMKTKQSMVKYLREGLDNYRKSVQLEESIGQAVYRHLLKESTLSKLIGDAPSGQYLVRWMHARHRLSNVADWVTQPFNERVMWKEFKNHPDQFMIISASRGVAGIKPNESDIRRGVEKARKANREYNPAGDNTLRYQIVAFKDGEQVDPNLIRNPEDVEREADPTIMKARGGIPGKKDVRKEFNIFDSLADQIGTLQAIYISKSRVSDVPKQQVKGFVKGYSPDSTSAISRAGGGIEREKIAGRKPPEQVVGNEYTLRGELFKKLAPIMKPMMKRIGNVALLDIRDEIQDAIQAGAYDRVGKWTNVAKNVDSILVSINKQGALSLSQSDYTNPLVKLIQRSIMDAAAADGVEVGIYLNQLMKKLSPATLQSLMTAIKTNLIKTAL
jgi:hypothetical protein